MNVKYLSGVACEFFKQTFFGVIVILLAEIFKKAAEMKKEQELTV